MTTQAARIEYRNLRASSRIYTPARFDEIALRIAHEIADGECITPAMWAQAAKMIVTNDDDAANEAEMMCG